MARLEGVAILVIPTTLVLVVLMFGADATVSGESAAAPLRCAASDEMTIVQMEPVFMNGARSPMAALARVLGVAEERLAVHLVERASAPRRATLELVQGGVVTTRFNAVGAPAGWFIDGRETCSSAASFFAELRSGS
jgi:hypothetical protein